jgi:AAA domain
VAVLAASEEHEVELHGLLWEFREALRDELEAARRASASGAIQLLNGRRIAQVGGAYQYLFLVESALNAPDDSPGDLYVAGQRPIETTVISVEGLAVTLSVPVDLGEFVPRAALQSDLTHLLRKLIERIESLRDKANPAGDRLLGQAGPTGDPASIEADGLNVEQTSAVASSVGRDTTFIWGPPGTGKTRTIGRIGVELVRRGRSVLLVSHTNAAVDQAILKIADELGDELIDGTVLRLGEASDPALRARTRLLAETHIDERGAALASEREQLASERMEKAARSIEVQRLLAIWDWLPVASADINQSRVTLSNARGLELERDKAEETLAPLEREALAVLPRGEAARKAIEDAARADESRAALVQDEPALGAARASENEARRQKNENAELLKLSRDHRDNVDAAEAKRAELASQLESRRARLDAAAAELGQADAATMEAEELLARSIEASGLVRRWRGLPKPEEQQETVESLRVRRTLASAELDEQRRLADGLEREWRDGEALLAKWGHLPTIEAQTATVERLGKAEQEARARRDDLENRVDAARASIAVLGDPRAAFVDAYGMTPDAAVETADAFERVLQQARSDVATASSAASEAYSALESELDMRLTALREWGLSVMRSGFAEAMLDEIERARDVAQEIVAETEPPILREEWRSLNGRIRTIDHRLEEIEDELQRVEELVVADAWVVATTLTRAYKRESVQKRRFDTVILDEASMAPIPALWVAAALADVNVILVGDFRQLPPIKHADSVLAEKWLGTDVFEASGVKAAYNANEPPPFFVQLQEQFRMHPDISAIPNRFLYEGKLRDWPGVEQDNGRLDGWFERDWGYDSPVLLVDTGSLNAWVTSVNNAGRTSRLNFLSATVCVDLAEMLLKPERPESVDDTHAF